jgi:hypothetical protein
MDVVMFIHMLSFVGLRFEVKTESMSVGTRVSKRMDVVMCVFTLCFHFHILMCFWVQAESIRSLAGCTGGG